MAVLLWQHNPNTRLTRNFSTVRFRFCPKKKALDCLMTSTERSCQHFRLHDAWAIAVHWWGLLQLKVLDEAFKWPLSWELFWQTAPSTVKNELSGDIQTFRVSVGPYVSHHAIKTCLCLIWKTPMSYNSKAPVYNTESVVFHKLLKPAHNWSF